MLETDRNCSALALLRSVIGRKKKPRHPLKQSDVKSKPIATRSLTFSRFCHGFFFCLFCFFLFFLFFFWVSSYLASCEELLLVPENTKNYFKQLPVHCKQIACIAKKIRDCFSSTRTEVFSNHFISLSFFSGKLYE